MNETIKVIIEEIQKADTRNYSLVVSADNGVVNVLLDMDLKNDNTEDYMEPTQPLQPEEEMPESDDEQKKYGNMRYIEEDIIHALNEADEEVEGRLSTMKYRDFRMGLDDYIREIYPSCTVISKHFGSWSDALKAAKEAKDE